MNKRIFSLCLALMAVTTSVVAGDVLINQENFPDDNFRQFLLEQSYGEDGKLSERNIESIFEINVQNKGIKSLKGIEFFKYLEVLKCDINWDLGSLDVSQNTALKELSCSFCGLQELDVSQNTALKSLSCFACNLQELDVSKNTALTSLSCQYNDLRALDVSNNKELTFLWCEKDGLTSLSVEANTKLTYLNCSRNQLSSLSLLTNKDLQKLYCRNNALTELNLTYNNKLTYLDCAGNNINAAGMQDIVEALPTYTSGDHDFYVYDDEAETNNVITTQQRRIADNKRWWVYKTSGYTYSGVYGTAIHKTYFPDKKFRQFLLAQDYGKDCLLSNAEVNAITSLDVSGLGISNLTGIEYFTEVTALNCKNNQLQTLDLSKNTKLTLLACYNNQIKGQQMDALVASLPSSSDIKTIYVISGGETEQNDMTTTQVAAAKEKNWIPYNYNNGSPVSYDGRDPNIAINEKNFPDENFRNYLLSQKYGTDGILTEEEVQSITMLSLTKKEIKNLKGIELFPNLTSIFCSKNSLTSIDVSKNTELVTLECKDNQLTSLDLSKNTKLRCLYCERNKLTSLDVSACPELFDLFCEGNQILGSGMDMLVNSLHEKLFGSEKLQVRNESYTQDNLMTPSQVKIATDKGWRVLIDNGVDRMDYEGEELLSIDEKNFPDANFRKSVADKTIDKNEDGYLSEAEVKAVTTMDVKGLVIQKMKGIEYFTELQVLHCHGNALTTLDLSKNTKLTELTCDMNGLSSLDLSANTLLTTLSCSLNSITSLDFTRNTALTKICCSGNQIQGKDMDKLVNSLPTVKGGKLYVNDDYRTRDNLITAAQVKVATGKGWRVMKTTGTGDADYAGQGDANGDNKINQDDLDLIEQIVMGKVPEGVVKLAGDMNNDGVVNAADVVIMVNILNGK